MFEIFKKILFLFFDATFDTDTHTAGHDELEVDGAVLAPCEGRPAVVRADLDPDGRQHRGSGTDLFPTNPTLSPFPTNCNLGGNNFGQGRKPDNSGGEGVCDNFS